MLGETHARGGEQQVAGIDGDDRLKVSAPEMSAHAVGAPVVVVRPETPDGGLPDGSTRSWFENGALEVTTTGLTLVDAAGARHPLPVPPGGHLVSASGVAAVGGRSLEATHLFVTDATGTAVVRLPPRGWQTDDLRDLAAAAGLAFRRRIVPGLPAVRDLWPSLSDAPRLERLDRLARPPRVLGRLLGGDWRGGAPTPPGGGPTGATAPTLDPAGVEGYGDPTVRAVERRPRQPSTASTAEARAQMHRLDEQLTRSERLLAVSELTQARRANRSAALDAPVSRPEAMRREMLLRLTVEVDAAGRQVAVAATTEEGDPVATAPAAAPGRAAHQAVLVEVFTFDECTLAARLADRQRLLPIVGLPELRLRVAIRAGTSGAVPVAVLDQPAATAAGVELWTPPGDPGMPHWWQDAVDAVGVTVRDVVLAVGPPVGEDGAVEMRPAWLR
jgi:hypothetical protein